MLRQLSRSNTSSRQHWRWTFSSRLTRSALLDPLLGIPHSLFTLFFPDDCRVCERPLDRWTRVPVCHDCLTSPAPLEADHFCRTCHTPFINDFPLDDFGICKACRAGLRGFDKAATFGLYEGSLRSLIHLFKYRGMTPLAKPLSTFLEFAIPDADRFDAVVPVPLHWKKQWSRGFNQAELLARPIARRRGIPVLKALRRSRSTEVQASLTMAARRKNVQAAFSTRRGAELQGKRILLIDDVMTTGATAGACAMALKRAGAASVTLAVLARVDKRF